MNGTYEIEYHCDWQTTRSEVVTVDGRSQRQNRTPQCLINHATKQAGLFGAYRYRIHRVKLRHITASNTTNMITQLIYEQETNNETHAITNTAE